MTDAVIKGAIVAGYSDYASDGINVFSGVTEGEVNMLYVR